LLGYKNFSEYTLTLLCAKNPGNVNSFLDKLGDKLRVLQLKEMEILLEYKRKEVIPYKIIIIKIGFIVSFPMD
jgi:Zn-dependent oligopeptidase